MLDNARGPSPAAPDRGASSTPRLRIAIASRDGASLDAHFGSAEKFMVYDVTPGGHELVQAIAVTQVSDESGDHKAESEDKNGRKIAALAGCNIVFVLAVGAPVAAKILAAKIHPIKVAEPESIDSVIARMKTLMVSEPPPWLRKVLAATSSARSMSFLDEE